jgi:CRISPR-associated protein Cas6/Cse3/CasE subtype I-E
MNVYHTILPHLHRNRTRLDAYHRHQIAWSLLQNPEQRERNFVFYVNDKGPILQFHFISNTPLIDGLSKKIIAPPTNAKLRWKILCNPVNKMGNKKIAIRDIKEAKNWLQKKLQGALKLLSLNAEFLPTETSRKPNGTSLTIQQMLVEGTGIVLDPEKLLELTLHGIGPSKAFGYGCLLWNQLKPSE